MDRQMQYNSWYMAKPLEQCPNLFKKEHNGYMVHFYHCECGCSEAVISAAGGKPEYCCASCANREFFDGRESKESIMERLHEKLYRGYAYVIDQKSATVMVSVYLPVDTDFIRKKIIFEKHTIDRFSINPKRVDSPLNVFDGRVVEKSELKPYRKEERSWVEQKYGEKLKRFSRKEQENIQRFFLRYPYLDGLLFYAWKMDTDIPLPRYNNRSFSIEDMLLYILNGKKERSVKRTLFGLYETFENKFWEGVSEDSSSVPLYFYPKTSYVLCRSIDDPNLLSTLLKANLHLTDVRYGSVELHDIIWLIQFLKKHYSEKNISRFLQTIEENDWLWMDTWNLIAGNRDVIEELFQKVRLSKWALHNEIVRCVRLEVTHEKSLLKFAYDYWYYRACTTLGDLEFKLPDSAKELIAWADTLNNCLRGYVKYVEKNHVLIYGVFKNDKLLYAVAIYRDKIHEAHGKNNTPVPPADMGKIYLWHGKFLCDV